MANSRPTSGPRYRAPPKIRGAGVELYRKLGDTVGRGEPLYRVHAEFPSDLAFARQWAANGSGYTVGEPGEAPRDFAGF